MNMKTKAFAPLLALALMTGTTAVEAQTSPAPNNYADGANWLCRPGRQDACSVDMSTTVVAADGSLSREAWSADPAAPIDCFYVYPTVSTDSTTNSDMMPDPAERGVVEQQFARFASVCRPYAPSYRQVTLRGLTAAMSGGGVPDLGSGLAYNDVRDAFRYYIDHDNGGRGFVLIGHSQGSFILIELLRQEIDGKPVQNRLVSTILLGTTVSVPTGKDVGGSFRTIPLCHRASQTGCVITYASFRSTAPPPANTLFGHVTDAGMTGACTNPAALGGGSGQLHAYLSAPGKLIVMARQVPPWATGATVETPFVSVPGLLTAQCSTNENATFLEITVHGDPADPRVDNIIGDITPQWGLHLVDMNLAMGNFIDIVRQQAAAWRAKS
jgi:Protein of unknown function (DUF3089)